MLIPLNLFDRLYTRELFGKGTVVTFNSIPGRTKEAKANCSKEIEIIQIPTEAPV